jgi:hypothetical protein
MSFEVSRILSYEQLSRFLGARNDLGPRGVEINSARTEMTCWETTSSRPKTTEFESAKTGSIYLERCNAFRRQNL